MISDLPTKPESLNAYLNITIGDTTYYREDGIDGFMLYGNYVVPAENYESEVEIGATIIKDFVDVDLSIRYTHDKQSRNQLVDWLIRDTQDVADGYYNDDGIYQLTSYGFLFGLVENDLVNGGGSGYPSNVITQPLSSYFHIE